MERNENESLKEKLLNGTKFILKAIGTVIVTLLAILALAIIGIDTIASIFYAADNINNWYEYIFKLISLFISYNMILYFIELKKSKKSLEIKIFALIFVLILVFTYIFRFSIDLYMNIIYLYQVIIFIRTLLASNDIKKYNGQRIWILIYIITVAIISKGIMVMFPKLD